MRLKGKRIGVLIESDYFEKEIFYYQFRFQEEGAELHLLSRLWGQERITFTGHEYKVPLECNQSFEDMSNTELSSYDAIIVPSGYVSDRLRYTDNINNIPPATEFLKRAFADSSITKGIICHGLWLAAPAPELVRGRKMTLHNNLLGDAKNMGVEYQDQDVVVDGDLVSGRTGMHCHLFASRIIEILSEK